MMPGATGMRHGPLGDAQTVPALPISQLAAGMVSAKPVRKITPSASLRASRSTSEYIKVSF